jgi:hypothetical protein
MGRCMTEAYPKRSLLRRGLDACSISQSTHTMAMPSPTTRARSSNVRAGAVSMENIHQAAISPGLLATKLCTKAFPGSPKTNSTEEVASEALK